MTVKWKKVTVAHQSEKATEFEAREGEFFQVDVFANGDLLVTGYQTCSTGWSDPVPTHAAVFPPGRWLEVKTWM